MFFEHPSVMTFTLFFLVVRVFNLVIFPLICPPFASEKGGAPASMFLERKLKQYFRTAKNNKGGFFLILLKEPPLKI